MTMGPEVSSLVEGWSDQDLDVWELFERDAHGRTGLYAGQLVAELAAGRPGVVSKIVDALRRGLASADPAEQAAALAGVAALPVDLASSLADLATRNPALAKTRRFVDAVVAQPEGASGIDAVLDQMQANGVDPDAEAAFGQALMRHRPDASRATLWSAVTTGASISPRATALVRAMSPLAIDNFFSALAAQPDAARQHASDLVYAAYDAATQPGAYDRWLELRSRAGLSDEGVPARPFESEADIERRRRFAAMVSQLT